MVDFYVIGFVFCHDYTAVDYNGNTDMEIKKVHGI